jgi:RNA recognition motif-containing protein
LEMSREEQKSSAEHYSVFVKNTPDNCNAKDIHDLFGKFGKIERVSTIPNKDRSKNPFFVVRFFEPAAAA